MTFDTLGIIERYVHATRGRTYHDPSIERVQGDRTAGVVKSRDRLILGAAGMTRHWGIGLIRLKFANDAAEFHPALIHFEKVAVQTSRKQGWGDDELARFLARFVLLGWLLGRSFRGKSEWKEKSIILRQQLYRAQREAASLIALKLGR